MSESSLTAMISDVVSRKLEEQKPNQQSQQMKKCLNSSKLELLLEKINEELQGRKPNTLNCQMAECQGLLAQFHASYRKINEDIQHIRQILLEIQQCVDAKYRNEEPSEG